MTSLIVILTILLLFIVIIQIGKVRDLSAKIRGEETAALKSNNRTAILMLLFMIVFLILSIGSMYYYKNSMLGYGPHESASEHGVGLDSLFNVTLLFTGIVFVLTHIALFWFAFKYRKQPGRKSFYFPHNNTLELIWTIVPTVVLVYLVVKGLLVWNDVMPDVPAGEEVVQIEATGYQFAWDLRYPGPDGQLGPRDFKLINPANNPLGQDWTDERNFDDFHASEIVLPVGKKVRVQITSKDVLHNFYLPHFRVKMDAVPGLPTYFVFTPTKTTEEYRTELSNYPEWQVPAEENEPDGPKRWQNFNFELACAELCGEGHYSMRRLVRIVSEPEYEQWLNTQQSYYLQNIRHTEADPNIDKLLNFEIQERTTEFLADVTQALQTDDASDNTIVLKHVFFDTGASTLKDYSRYELNNVVQVMKDNADIRVELGGHTDNTGDESVNLSISRERAGIVQAYLVNKGIDASRIVTRGYGSSSPLDSNDTEEGRKMNRRTEMKIIAQ